ncbi:ABC transporter substrate-binding protein [Halolamina sp. C58]|uniref:ABC transporter substrate-binding protein n=1 Tax=Halolamina sp. C58 TaxID=3421640 RepID=UPI003EBAF6F7
MAHDNEEHTSRNDSSDRTVDRRTYLAAAGAAGLTATAGCIGPFGGSGGGGPLNIIVWNDYTEVQDQLEERVGRTINMTAMTSSTKMFSKWNAGGADQFDMALPNNNLVNKFYQADLLQSINTDGISNWGDMYGSFQDLANQQFQYDGSMYGVPIRFGWYGISYDKEQVSESGRKTTETLWNDEYEGKIAVYDNHFKALGMAALHLGFQDAFEGDTVSLSDSQLEECKQALIDQKPLLFGYLAGNPSWVKAYQQENVYAGWSGRNEIVQLQQDGVSRAGTTVAEEGGLAWYEAAIISQQSENKEAVQDLINAMLDPEIGAQLAEAGGAPTTNPGIEEHLTEEQQNMFMVDPSRMESLIPFKPMEDEQAWISAWEEVKDA